MNGLGRSNQEKPKKNSLLTKETMGVVLILFATLCLICLITRETLFSLPGQYVNAFLMGAFGYFSYAVVIYLISVGVCLVADRKFNMNKKRKAMFTLAFLALATLCHVVSMAESTGTPFGDYVLSSYAKGEGGIATASAGGIITGVIAYVFSALLTNVGSYVVLSVILAVLVYAIIIDFVKNPTEKRERKTVSGSFSNTPSLDQVQVLGERDYPVQTGEIVQAVKPIKPEQTQALFVNNPSDFSFKTKKEINKGESPALKIGFSEEGLGVFKASQSYSTVNSQEIKDKIEYIKTPVNIDVEKTISGAYSKPYQERPSTTVSDYVNVRIDTPNNEKNIPMFEHDRSGENVKVDSAEFRAEQFTDSYANIADEPTSVVHDEEVVRPLPEFTEEKAFDRAIEQPEQETTEEIPFVEEFAKEIDEFTRGVEQIITPTEPQVPEEPVNDEPSPSIVRERRFRDIFGDEPKEEPKPEIVEEKKVEPEEPIAFTSRVNADSNGRSNRMFGFGERQKEEPKAEPVAEEKPKKPAPPINRKYFRPPLDLLETRTLPMDAPRDNHEERMEIIKKTLEDFKISTIPQSYVQGPSITRYEIMMPAGISVKRVLGYDDDLRMRLSATNGIRIEAPIPGKNLVGVEVANTVPTPVGLKEVMEGIANKKSGDSSLIFALGKNIVGECMCDDLTKGPHYLIAGATGSGKSVALHTMIVSMLMRYSPEELRLVLIDPKSVEFRKYEHIPHLLVDEIITEHKRALALLQWAYDETNRRNNIFNQYGGVISKIEEYNSQIASETIPRMPRIVIIIDELADLMESAKKDLEARIRMIAAKSRSAGIHLVLATQRPSVDVITGTIKANLPSRIALKVMNFNDSQTILSEAGAEKLLGNGDMLYKNSSMPDCERYQGAYISGREITNIVNYIKEHNKAYFDDEVSEYIERETKPKQEESMGGVESSSDPNELDDFFLKALWLAVTSESVSISQLQRRFQIGYARAGGIVDKMERLGFVSPNEGSKARRVLITRQEFEDRFGPMDEAF